MNKIEQKAIGAVLGGHDANLGNTEVTHANGVASVRLFGHLIAEYVTWRGDKHRGALRVWHAGYPTRTTASRINALVKGLTGVSHNAMTVRKGEPLFEGTPFETVIEVRVTLADTYGDTFSFKPLNQQE